MNPSNRKIDRVQFGLRRNGISLIEVIACMAIVGITLVPISSVMRSSRQAISLAENGDVQTDLRDGSRWLRQLIQDNTVTYAQSEVLVLQLTTGDYVKIYMQDDELVMDNGKEAVTLMTDVLDVAFGEIKQSTYPEKLVGVKMAVYMLDPASGEKQSLTSVVSIPTQY